MDDLLREYLPILIFLALAVGAGCEQVVTRVMRPAAKGGGGDQRPPARLRLRTRDPRRGGREPPGLAQADRIMGDLKGSSGSSEGPPREANCDGQGPAGSSRPACQRSRGEAIPSCRASG